MRLKLLGLISLLFSINLSASYMYYDWCIEDYYFKDGYFYVIRSDTNDTYEYTSFYKYRFDDGYTYNSDTATCEKKQILKDLQVSNNTYYGLIGLIGVLVGFTFLFFGVYIAVDVAKK